MENQNNKGGGGFFAGLLVGAAVGALISTKKGRQILKDLSDYGLEYVGKAINLEDIETILNEEEEEMSPYAKASEDKMDEEKEEHSRRKRLFKGIKK